MESEDYEIMPHKQLASLKEELKKLKSKSVRKTSHLDAESMDNLAASIQELMALFKDASKELKNEENEEAHILQKLTEAIETMNVIADQNEKIAEGIVTVAEMIKDRMPKKAELPKQSSTVFGVPVLGEAPRSAPQQEYSPPNFSQQAYAPPRFSQPPQQEFTPPQQNFGSPQNQQMNDPFGLPPMGSPPAMPPPNFGNDSYNAMPPPPTPPPGDIPPPPAADRKGLLNRFK